jgi:drug/metabolite transporter (DMT)-like permease
LKTSAKPVRVNAGYRFSGIVLVVTSAITFGTLAIFGRLAYAQGIDTLTILAYRFILAAGLMGMLLVARKERMPRGSVLIRLVGMGAIGYVGQAFAYFTALKYASAGLVALLLYLYPLFVTLLAAVVLRERITGLKWLALVLAVVGAALTVRPESGQLVGVLLAIAAALIYSGYIIVGAGVMKEVSAIQSSTVIFASAGVTFVILTLLNRAPMTIPVLGWWVVAGIVLVATLIPVTTFLAGLERIGPSDAAMLSTLEPVVTVLLAAGLFGEVLRPVTLLGGGFILSAVLLVTRYASSKPTGKYLLRVPDRPVDHHTHK